MTLGSLAGLERLKIEEELAAKLALIAELEAILADDEKVREVIEKDLLAIKEKFADGRRTDIPERYGVHFRRRNVRNDRQYPRH